MGGARTKMDENSEYASGRVASEHSLSPQSSALSTIFVGDTTMKQLTLIGMVMLLWLTACAAANSNEPSATDSDKPVVTVYKSPT